MNKLKKFALTIVLFSGLCLNIGCAKKEQELSRVDTLGLSVDPVEASLESGLSSLQGLGDEQSGGNFAQVSTPANHSPLYFLNVLLLEKAYASGCQRAVFQSCMSSSKQATYSQCEVPGTSFQLNGSVQLSYSDAACGLSSTGNTVTRTYNTTYSGPRGGQLTFSSALQSDYKGNSYSGGGRITRTAGGWNIDVLGKHKSFQWRGNTLYSVSMRTLAPHQITGSLSRSSRVLDGGTLEVNHNIAQFTVLVQPQNVQWTNSCCHPVSGSLNLNFSGSKTGTATLNFSSQCGLASLVESGQTKEIQLSYCE
jgi:hypothetical protein